MKIYKQAVLIENNHNYLEIVSFYNSISRAFGIELFYHDKLIETLAPLWEEPTRELMRFVGNKFIITN